MPVKQLNYYHLGAKAPTTNLGAKAPTTNLGAKAPTTNLGAEAPTKLQQQNETMALKIEALRASPK